MHTAPVASEKTIYWHRELPPVHAEPIGEHTVEATSGHVPDTIASREELWHRCYADLMGDVDLRLKQEIDRLGGRYAHVLGEAIDTKHDPVAGETWLRGRFTYVLYRDHLAPASP